MNDLTPNPKNSQTFVIVAVLLYLIVALYIIFYQPEYSQYIVWLGVILTSISLYSNFKKS